MSDLATLYITVPDFLTEEYECHVNAHNLHVLTDSYPNSGFDLIVPNDITFNVVNEVNTIDHKVCAELRYLDGKPGAYMLIPRSSIAKTPLSMANSVGIIDAGYRGTLMAKIRFNAISNDINSTYTIQAGVKLFQICLPTLAPFKVSIVPILSTTIRGEGAFGSTD